MTLEHKKYYTLISKCFPEWYVLEEWSRKIHIPSQKWSLGTDFSHTSSVIVASCPFTTLGQWQVPTPLRYSCISWWCSKAKMILLASFRVSDFMSISPRVSFVKRNSQFFLSKPDHSRPDEMADIWVVVAYPSELLAIPQTVLRLRTYTVSNSDRICILFSP